MIFALPKEFGGGVRDVVKEPFMDLGECYFNRKEGNLYRFVRFNEAVTKGQNVQTQQSIQEGTLAPATSGGSDYPAAGTRKIIEHNANYLTSLEGLPSGEVPHFAHGVIAIEAGAGVGQSGVIQQYANKELNIDWYAPGQALQTALDGTTQYVIYAPWLMVESDADSTGMVNGVVVADEAEARDYGFVLESGRAPVRVGVDVFAGVALKPASANTDQGEGVAITAADVYDAFATTEHAGTANSLVWCNVYCKPISKVFLPPEELTRAFGPQPVR